MTITSPARRAVAGQQARLGVPWSTLVPLAAVMAYADGFWMTSLRGAVGAIERTQSPYATWWRESTLILPVYVFAVLAAMMLAMRWFGPVLRKGRTVLATALLIAAAGTVVGIAEIAASSAYDYDLQVNQLTQGHATHGICPGGCLAQERHATLAVHIHAVIYISRWLLLTNVVVVAWLVALRGGRVKLSATRAARGRPIGTQTPTGSRVADLRLLVVVGLLAGAAIHAAVVPGQLRAWTAAGVFFILLAVAEVVLAGLLLTRLQPAVLRAAGAISGFALMLWLYSRIAGLPFGPRAGVPEGVRLPDSAACLLELATLLAAVALLRPTGRITRSPASAHVKALTLVALTAVTVIGLAGTSSAWSHDLASSGSQSGVIT